MLQKVNLALNIILLAAVVYLFVQINSNGISTNPSGDTANTNVDSVATDTSSNKIRDSRFAYVNAERLNEEYRFIADKYEELEKEQMRIESQIERKLRAAENRYLELEKQAPTMTQTELQDAQIELQNLQQDIAAFQEKAASDFRQKEAAAQEEFFESISSFLEEFNADGQYDFIYTFQVGGQILLANDSLDITNEVVRGLNERYEASKAQPTE